MARQLSTDDLEHLTEVIATIFRAWDVSAENQLRLLGRPAGAAAAGTGQPPADGFPSDEESLDRAEQLLAIHECLRTAYPRSGIMAAHWLRQPHRRMDSRAPLQVMLEDGLPGLRQVRGLLDCTQNWI
jgi:hypothetical protein